VPKYSENYQDLKDSLEGYTTDSRTLKGCFHNSAMKLDKEIKNLLVLI